MQGGVKPPVSAPESEAAHGDYPDTPPFCVAGFKDLLNDGLCPGIAFGPCYPGVLDFYPGLSSYYLAKQEVYSMEDVQWLKAGNNAWYTKLPGQELIGPGAYDGTDVGRAYKTL